VAFIKALVFACHTNPRRLRFQSSNVSTFKAVLKKIRFYEPTHPFSIVLMWMIGGNAQKSIRFQTKID
jgi:hypothetical protein